MLSTVKPLSEAFCETATEHPEREALVCGSTRLTYAALAARSDAVAWKLCQMGIRKGDRVASLLPPGWQAVTLLFALAKLGAVSVPLNPQFRRRLLGSILQEIQPVALVASGPPHTSEETATIREIARQIAGLRHFITTEEGADDSVPYTELIADSPPASFAPEPVALDDLAIVLYTSGTTGQPKGVMHSHRGLVSPVVASLRLRRMWLHSPSPAQLVRMAGLLARYGTRLLQVAGRPQTFLTAIGGHTIGGLEAMLQALLMGDKLVLMPHFHPAETLRLIEKEKVTILIAVPLAFSILVRMQDLERYDLSSLFLCGTGAAPCSPDLARQIQERLKCALHIGFGTTEIGGGISATSIEDSPDAQAETVGRVLPGMEVRIVDENRNPLPPGQVGELACRSESRMLGYYGAPDLTRDVIDEQGWYYTGDLALIDDKGFIRIVGRKKDLIIRGGQNIYPAEVEHFLMSHPKIREAAVVGIPVGPDRESVWAFVCLEEGSQMTAKEVLDYCRAELEAYKIPDQVRFVQDLPRSALGKVQKNQLRDWAIQETKSSSS